MPTNKCIICRKIRSNFTEEHVIPDAIGGRYVIHTVCKACNDRLGRKVDLLLTDHYFTKFFRLYQNLPGKSGKLPNPFDGTHSVKGESDTRVRLELNEDGHLTPFLIPKVEGPIEENGKQRISISIDSRNKESIDSIVKKICKRRGLDPNRIESREIKPIESHPWILMEGSVDPTKYRIAFLKMAYEFAATELHGYLKDPLGKRISKVLLNGNYGKEDEDWFFIGDGLDKEIMTTVGRYLNLDGHSHFMILADAGIEGTLCLIRVASFALGVRVSERSGYLTDGFKVLVNRIDPPSVEVLSADEVIKRVYRISLPMYQLWIPNPHDAYEYSILRQEPGTKIASIDGETSFYDRKGRIVYEKVSQKMEQPGIVVNQVGDGEKHLVFDYKMDEELFIRLLPMNRFYRVLTIRVTHDLVGQLG